MNKTKFLAKDFMRPFTVVSKDEQLPQAFWTLESTGETHLVIVQDDKPIGIISYKDFLRVLTNRARRGIISRLYVSSIMTTRLHIVTPDTPISEVAKKMLNKGISSMIIIGEEKEKGIITKRDILKHIQSLPLKSIKVKEIMNRQVMTVPSGLSITGAERLLREKKISTLPVVEEGILIGYLDAHILAGFLINLYLNSEQKHPDNIIRETTVGDIMKGLFYVFETDDLQTFAQKILRRKFKGAPVILSEANRKVIGIITETDIIRLLSEM